MQEFSGQSIISLTEIKNETVINFCRSYLQKGIAALIFGLPCGLSDWNSAEVKVFQDNSSFLCGLFLDFYFSCAKNSSPRVFRQKKENILK